MSSSSSIFQISKQFLRKSPDFLVRRPVASSRLLLFSLAVSKERLKPSVPCSRSSDLLSIPILPVATLGPKASDRAVSVLEELPDQCGLQASWVDTQKRWRTLHRLPSLLR